MEKNLKLIKHQPIIPFGRKTDDTKILQEKTNIILYLVAGHLKVKMSQIVKDKICIDIIYYSMNR